ncbi:MAG: hypothetical protein JNK90_13255 [Planctomycetaceae bacterium]|nr:hypothetical protein [Planctomycetaceae bacterium]
MQPTELMLNHTFFRSTSFRSTSPSKRWLGILAFAFLCVNLGGCNDTGPEIRSYDVPRQKNNPLAKAPTESTVPAVAEPRRTLGAIIPAGNEAWFLKAIGTPENVQALVPSFEKLIGSFTLQESGEPKWELPENWKQQPGSGMRFATLIATSNNEEIPISVIKLPIFDGTWEEYCESNVNRWRGELSLASEKWDEIVKYAKPIDGKETAAEGKSRLGYWINIEGKQDASRSMAGPMGGGNAGTNSTSANSTPATSPPANTPPFAPFAGGAMAAPPGATTELGDPSPLKYETPAGWKDLGSKGLRLLTMIIGDKKDPANEVTIIPASGDLPSNVRRWQEQISQNVTDEMVTQAIEKATVTKVDGIETKIVFLVDSPDQPKESIMAAIIPMDEQSSLFIKYKGDAATAETEKANFIKFVESVRWK